jgi:hypothetical protein
MLKTDSMNNATGELLNCTVSIWFFIQNSNDKTEEQTLLVIGHTNNSISIQETEVDKFELSLKHMPLNVSVNNFLFLITF